jgi:dynein heavy chain 1
MEHNIQTGTAMQEINFWMQMERSLSFINRQYAIEEVEMTFQILRQSGMMRLIVQFTSDTEINPKLKTAREFTKMLEEIPLKTLLEATTFDQIAAAIKKILAQLKRARTVGTYPLNRALDLCELIA